MKRKGLCAAVAAVLGVSTLFGADSAVKWSYDASKHPAAVNVSVASASLDPSFDARLCVIVYGPFGLPSGMWLIFK